MLVKARSDAYFKKVLNGSDLNLCDGRGLQFFSVLPLKRLTGTDFVPELAKIAAETEQSIFLLGSYQNNAAERAGQKLVELCPGLLVVGSDKGPAISEDPVSGALIINQAENQAVIDKINLTKPAILLVAFGMGKQEKWIYENLGKLPSVKIAMGVGGAFNYLAGFARRAPCWMRQIGLEWLYRVLHEPERLLRILTATVTFTWFAAQERYGKK